MCPTPGAARAPTSEFWIYGSEGTLHLDLDDGKLSLGLRSEGVGALQVRVAAWRLAGGRLKTAACKAFRIVGKGGPQQEAAGFVVTAAWHALAIELRQREARSCRAAAGVTCCQGWLEGAYLHTK